MADHPVIAACKKGVISPIKSWGNRSYPRLEIDAFCQNEKRLNLYLLALAELQKNDVENLKNIWSYFRISAVHGKPSMEYNGCGADATYEFLRKANRHDEIPNDAKVGGGTSGFCVHGSVLFPSWHRAYALLIEQALQAKMLQIAKLIPDSEYVELADQFRQPYWDMFQPRAYDETTNIAHIGISWIFCVKQVQVNWPITPEKRNEWKTIPNPLYAYRLPAADDIISAFGVKDSKGSQNEDLDKLNKGLTGFLTSRDFHNGATTTFRQRNLTAATKDGDPKSDHAQLQRTLIMTSDPNNMLLDQDQREQHPYVPGVAYDANTFRSAGMRAKLYACLTQTLDDDLGLAYCRFAAKEFVDSYKKNRVNITDPRAPPEPRSLESFHDDIHRSIGGSKPSRFGTMTPTSIASYDPIFYPFHAGIDLHYGLFLAAHPELRFMKENEMYTTAATFTQARLTQEAPDTPLTPLRKARPDEKFRFKFSRTPKSDYLTTEDLYNEDDWKFYYEPLGPGPSPETAKSYINHQYGWLNPTAAHMTDHFISNADYNLLPTLIHDMRRVRAFVPNGPGLYPWPPLIDDNKTIVELHPPAAETVNNAPVAFVVPSAVAPLAEPSHRVTRAVVSTHNSVKMSEPPTNFSVVSRSQVSNDTPSTKKSEEEHLEEQPDVMSDSVGPLQERERRTPTSFVYDPPHPEHLYYNFPNHVVKNGREMQNWSFQMRYERFALNSAFTVYVFVGDFPADPQHWHSWGNLALAAHNFASPEPERMNPDYSGKGDNPNREPSESDPDSTEKPACANCARQAASQALVGDWVPLTPILLDYVLTGRKASNIVPESEATLASLEQSDVIPFLKRHLHWRILRDDGVEIHRSDVAQFVAWVHDEVMLLPRRWDEMPEYKDHAIQWDITHGRPGGLDHGDWP